ncbi:MAG TPA: hypothetical protein VE934_08770 [Polaromonas sp.]|uniref:hypothetical protein n=1 Tax=Polaromonas sp. TaxID=1869339 RepID=UPI002D3BEE2C|nr:hypothetical protein [Polaromonas sp.]HYW57041.1 hypothetical protein [Polaromonas sp.]
MNTKSRKSSKPTKAASPFANATQPTEPANPGTVSDTEQDNLVRIHDLTGFAALCIPATLRELIGDEAYERHTSNIESRELIVILRDPSDVVYIRMPIVHFPLGHDIPESQDAIKPQARKGAKVSAKGKSKLVNPSAATSRKLRQRL